MPESKMTVVKLVIEGNKFEILVKPDLALEYRLGKRNDLTNVLISDEVYSDANKGSRVLVISFLNILRRMILEKSLVRSC